MGAAPSAVADAIAHTTVRPALVLPQIAGEPSEAESQPKCITTT